MYKLVFFTSHSSPLTIESLPGLTVETIQVSMPTAIDWVVTEDADMVLLAINTVTPVLLGSIQKFCESYPAKVVMLFLEASTIECMIDLMKIGIRDVVIKSDDINKMVKWNLDKLTASNPPPSAKHARRIGLLSAKGGDGGTSILANLAATISQDPSQKVLLIDMSILFGDVEIYVTNQAIKNDLSDYCAVIDRLDTTLINNMANPISDNFHLIPTVSDISKLSHINKENVQQLINKLSEHYDTLLFDMSLGIDPINVQLLDQCDTILVVSTLSIPSARRATQILKYLDVLGIKPGITRLILSRMGGPVSFTVEEYEKAVGISIWHKIYRDYIGIEESILKGIPLIQHDPKSKFSESIIELSAKITGHVTHTVSPLWKRLGIN